MTPEAIAAAALNGLTPDEIQRILTSLKRTVNCFIDPTAKVHPSVKVWHYAVVLQDVELSEGVQIGSHCEIGRGSKIGARTRIGKGTFLPPNSVVGEDVFIGPHVACTDDRYPFVRKPTDGPYNAQPPVFEDGANIGLGAVFLPGIRVGRGAIVGAGAIVTSNVLPGQVVRGEPARTRLPDEISPDAKVWLEELVGVRLQVVQA